MLKYSRKLAEVMFVPSSTLTAAFQRSRHFRARFFPRPFLAGWVWGPDYNILLTTDLRAKIADLGVAKLLESQTQVAIAQTKAPGTLYYMPPEALQENPVYDLKLDIFSFGHLMLYAASQKFPDVHELDDSTMYVALKQNTIQIHRRRKVIEQIGGKQHCLHSLLTQCLQDKLERRPTASELNERLKELCTKHPRSVAQVLKLITEADKVH